MLAFGVWSGFEVCPCVEVRKRGPCLPSLSQLEKVTAVMILIYFSLFLDYYTRFLGDVLFVFLCHKTSGQSVSCLVLGISLGRYLESEQPKAKSECISRHGIGFDVCKRLVGDLICTK